MELPVIGDAHVLWHHCNVEHYHHDVERLSDFLAICEGKPPVIDGILHKTTLTGVFPSQMASNTENCCFFVVILNMLYSKLWSCCFRAISLRECKSANQIKS